MGRGTLEDDSEKSKCHMAKSRGNTKDLLCPDHLAYSISSLFQWVRQQRVLHLFFYKKNGRFTEFASE